MIRKTNGNGGGDAVSDLTQRDLQVMEFIVKYQEKHGKKPTYEVISEELHIKATSQVAKHVKKLEIVANLKLLYVCG